MNEPDYFARAISALAFVTSILTAYLTIFRRGIIQMTKPAFIAFGYDDSVRGKPKAKVFIRSLLYSSGKRGQIVENMYMTVRRNETTQTFNVWGYKDKELTRGSGLFVGETGIAADHHFNPPSDIDFYPFVPGEYEICVFAALVGHKSATQLCSVRLTVPENSRQELLRTDAAIYFDWAPDSGKYTAHLKYKNA